ncbi:gluconokinase [Paracoccus zeaxanthinifaciens]|uniref:gluconokinase n=1 Tax=Paracoccus zeaxanthinifaciens TaxID=187400 RepID=UPI0003B4A568|nr:gluconokinase [Paracoccus zeaxanthinifaciens]
MTLRGVVMGVSGTGKTSVGLALARRLGVPYLDGDDLHPAGNVAKMAAGTPLTDADRWPWLDEVARTLSESAPVIVGCSALRRAYRDRLREAAGGPVTFFYLHGPRDVIAARMSGRKGHYMPPALLDSQIATLEPPGADEAVALDIMLPLDVIADTAIQAIQGDRT